jgi:hypothetical protein
MLMEMKALAVWRRAAAVRRRRVACYAWSAAAPAAFPLAFFANDSPFEGTADRLSKQLARSDWITST